MKSEKVEKHLKVKITKEEMNKMKHNHTHWESNADKFGTSIEVSWGDKNMAKLEVTNILKYISNKSLVLDAGCSNGASTVEIARSANIKMRAFDYSAKAIEIARKQQNRKKAQQKNITYYCGNILNIEEKDKTFDAAYTIRVIINLPSWHLQKQSILEVHRILKRGGVYLMSEAFSGSLKKLNTLRALGGVAPLASHDFNLYIKEEQLEKFIKPYFDIVAIKKFSSIYYVASRFLRYLTLKPGEKDSYDNEINNLFSKYTESENSGDFGIQKLYVLKKK